MQHLRYLHSLLHLQVFCHHCKNEASCMLPAPMSALCFPPHSPVVISSAAKPTRFKGHNKDALTRAYERLIPLSLVCTMGLENTFTFAFMEILPWRSFCQARAPLAWDYSHAAWRKQSFPFGTRGTPVTKSFPHFQMS